MPNRFIEQREDSRSRYIDKPQVDTSSDGANCGQVGASGDWRHSSKGPWDAKSGCVSWQEMQWEASFKDVPFAVETDSRSGGRRIHVHEYPSKEWWDNEDLGRLRQQIQVEGYVFGDKSDLWAEMLFAACTSPLDKKSTTGAGMLYLPMRVPLKAVCQTVESTFSADRMGRIDFSMSFSVEPLGYDLGIVPSEGRKPPNAVQLAHAVHNASNSVVTSALERFDQVFTGTQPATSRTTAAEYIRIVGRQLLRAAGAVRLTEQSGAVIEFIAQRFIDNSNAYADVQRTALNTMNRQAAVLAQRASGLSYYSQALRGVAIRASTGEVLPATGHMGEGFGGMLVNAFAILQSGRPRNRDRGGDRPRNTDSGGDRPRAIDDRGRPRAIDDRGRPRAIDDASDLAQALIPMTNLKPRIHRALSAAQLATASVKKELALAETVCSLTRRLALAHSIRAAIDVAPARQPDASLTRKRLLEQIDEEITLLPSDTSLQDNLRRMRRTVPDFVSHYSMGGKGSVKLPDSWKGKPLAAIAANVYGRNAAGRDLDLMRFNGISHPMFAPDQMVALNDGGGMSLSTEL